MSNGSYCMVRTCGNNKSQNSQVAFFTLPKNPDAAQKWVEFSGRSDLLEENLYLKKNYRICSAHFSHSQFKTINPRKLLKVNSYPSLNGPTSKSGFDINHVQDNRKIIIHDVVIVKPADNEQEASIKRASHIMEMAPSTPKNARMDDDLRCNKNSSTPISRSIPSKPTPRTAKKLKRLRKTNNALCCKLFRKQQSTKCICKGLGKYSYTRTTMCKLIKESKPFLSNEAHTLFSNELKAAFVNKYNRRYENKMKELCLLWYYASPKGYRTFSQVLKLPTPRSLRNWQKQLQINPGISTTVVESIKLHFNKTPHDEKEKIVSIIFDEISLSEQVHYDADRDKVIGVVDTGKIRKNQKAKSALVCMLRGMAHNWKHILGYWFLGGTTTCEFIYSIYINAIEAAAQAGLIVKSVVCDQSPANQSVAKQLGISPDHSYFFHDGQKIYFIYDVPHLLKSIRNNLAKYDLLYKDKVVSWKHIKIAVTTANPLRVRLLPKITSEHLNITTFNAMRVKYAAQVLSDSVSVALLVLQHLGELGSDALDTAEFISDIDKLFDCLNSCKLDNDKIKLRYAMSSNSPHRDFLIQMNKNLKTASFIGSHRNVPPCLKGWLITINSVLQLSEDLRSIYNVPKLLTRQLNQDPLENFFATVRQQHGCCRNPNAQQFENGLRHNYITSVAKLSENTNCENDFTYMLTKLTNLSAIEKDLGNSQEMRFESKDLAELTENVSPVDENALFYVSGFVVRKFLKLHNCDKCRSILIDSNKFLTGEHQLFTYLKNSDNIDSRKGLIFASEETYNFIKNVEVIHNEYFPK